MLGLSRDPSDTENTEYVMSVYVIGTFLNTSGYLIISQDYFSGFGHYFCLLEIMFLYNYFFLIDQVCSAS